MDDATTQEPRRADLELSGTITGLPLPNVETVIVREHHDNDRVEVSVEHAPPRAAISAELLAWVELAPWRGARFDGDVLTINARNGLFRYRVQPVSRPCSWDGYRGWMPQAAEFDMHRIDELS